MGSPSQSENRARQSLTLGEPRDGRLPKDAGESLPKAWSRRQNTGSEPLRCLGKAELHKASHEAMTQNRLVKEEKQPLCQP